MSSKMWILKYLINAKMRILRKIFTKHIVYKKDMNETLEEVKEKNFKIIFKQNNEQPWSQQKYELNASSFTNTE